MNTIWNSVKNVGTLIKLGALKVWGGIRTVGTAIQTWSMRVWKAIKGTPTKRRVSKKG